MYKYIILIIFTGVYALSEDVFSQANPVLETEQQQLDQKLKIRTLHHRIRKFLPDSLKAALELSKEAVQLSNEMAHEELIARSEYYFADILMELDAYDQVTRHFSAALPYYEKTAKKDTLADIYFKLGLVYYYQSNYNLSLQNYFEALKIYQNLENDRQIARVHQNLGLVYHNLNDLEDAIYNYNKSLMYYERIDDEESCASILHNIGLIYFRYKDYDSAEKKYRESLKIFKKYKFKEATASTLSNLGLLNEIRGRYDSAVSYYLDALEIFMEIGYKRGVVLATYNVGSGYHNLKNTEKAKEYYLKTIDLAKKYMFYSSLMDAYQSLSDLYEEQNDYKTSLRYYKLFDYLNDSIYSAESKAQIAEIESKYNVEIKEQELATQKALIKQKNIIIYSSLGGIVLLLTVITLLIFERKQKQTAQQELIRHKEHLEELVEQRTNELKLEISERKIAEESDKLKSSFLANMSHEIRTPMNSIMAFSNFLKDPDLPGKKREEYIKYITSSGQSLLQLIDDIIDSARLEVRQLKIHKTTVNINSLMEELHQVYSECKKEQLKQIEFIIDEETTTNEYLIKTDEQRLKQVINNLLENAFKYTEKGKIEFGVKKIGHHLLKFYIKDTGIGIPGSKLDIIFERFRQVEIALDRKYAGTGLGLSITKNLIELLGGKIWVVSKENIGSTFYFTLPYNHIEVHESNQAKKEKKKYSHNEINWKDKKILIAEDEDLNYRVLEIALRRTNAEVLRARDGDEAILLCNREEFDLILMDIQMPNVDGYKATSEIKKYKPHLPIIAQTSFALSEDKDKCIKAGCDDYVAKPINLPELLCKMGVYLEMNGSS